MNTSLGFRRTTRAIVGAASVALLGTAAIPTAEASAAGVATQRMRYVATQSAAVSPSALPSASTAGPRYVVTESGLLRRR
ncbi:hypothetical protein G9U51_11080 [Calidifontibacter sp. DB0510]|uniref:Uncharacterized protein n=1 Tax=Metallococcus carri TaxID=1656884 RepID=A0A967B1L0_9MICO|nr:hypothetical protein [Metallococcus carri]NHN56319.1 hypothetical protein [Metallococcus carri]NOP38629.1 hypothetical protein [Calidifontibacter sp. DB2511S]